MRPRQFTDSEMLAAARRCFVEHGSSVSTAVIAKEIGVSPAALFRRVGSKRELLMRALVPPMPTYVATLMRGPDERPVVEQLEELAVEIDAFFEDLFPLMAVMQGSGIHPQEVFAQLDEPPPVISTRALASWFSRLAEQGRVIVEKPVSVAVAFVGGLHGRHFLRYACGVAMPEVEPEHPRTYAKIFCRGILPPQSTSSEPTV